MNELHCYILAGFVGGGLCSKLFNAINIAQKLETVEKLSKLYDELKVFDKNANKFLYNNILPKNLNKEIFVSKDIYYKNITINDLVKLNFSLGYNDRFQKLRTLVKLPSQYFEETYNFPVAIIRNWECSVNDSFINVDLIFYVDIYVKYLGIDVNYEWLAYGTGLPPKAKQK